MRDELVKQGTKDFRLTGFSKNGGSCYNFVFSNGYRTQQDSSGWQMQDFIMPETIA